MNNERFVASGESRGVWSVWDRRESWWAKDHPRWVSRTEADALAKRLNQGEE